MLNISPAIIVIGLFALLSFSCAEFKKLGRDIGHGTRDVTRAIGHSSRDAYRSVKEDIEDASD